MPPARHSSVLFRCSSGLVFFQTNKFILWEHQYSLFRVKMQRRASPKPINPGFQSLNFLEFGKIFPDTAGGWVWKQHTNQFHASSLVWSQFCVESALLPVAEQSPCWACRMLISQPSIAVTHSLFTEPWMGCWALCAVFQTHSPCP